LLPLSENDNRFRSAKVKVMQCSLFLHSHETSVLQLHQNTKETH